MNAPVRLLPLVLFALTLSLAGPARAQPAPVPMASMGSRVSGGGFGFLFQPPAPRIIPAPGAAAGSFVPGAAPSAPARLAGPVVPRPSDALRPPEQCRAAIVAAEARHGIPRGLLAAIGAVESGRRDPATGQRAPWPWTVNAEGQGRYFDSKAEAVAWVAQARAGGMRSIDTGCMQVNMLHHPDAFASLDQAFDPAANADYAARFLASLRAGPAGGDWMRAAGYYHSQTPERAEGYRRHVQAALDGAGGGQSGRPYGATSVAYGTGPAAPAPAPAPSATPVAARPANGGGPNGGAAFLSNRAETASVIAAPAGAVGRGLDAYRAAPIPLVARLAMR